MTATTEELKKPEKKVPIWSKEEKEKLGEVYNITKDVVVEAYPDIEWGGRS